MELNCAAEDDVILSPNIGGESFGFIQAAADNDDFMEDTKDGKRTTRGTTMVQYQNQGSKPPPYNRQLLQTRRRS